jgi:hypothetical protein
MRSSFFDILRKKRLTQKELEELQAETDAAKRKKRKRTQSGEGKYTTRAELEARSEKRRKEWEKTLQEQRESDPKYQEKLREAEKFREQIEGRESFDASIFDTKDGEEWKPTPQSTRTKPVKQEPKSRLSTLSPAERRREQRRVRRQLESIREKEPEKFAEFDEQISTGFEDEREVEEQTETKLPLYQYLSNNLDGERKKQLKTAFNNTKKLWPKGKHPLEQEVSSDWSKTKGRIKRFISDLEKRVRDEIKRKDLFKSEEKTPKDRQIVVDIDTESLESAKEFFNTIYNEMNYSLEGLGDETPLHKEPVNIVLRRLLDGASKNKQVDGPWNVLGEKNFWSPANLRKLGFAIGRLRKARKERKSFKEALKGLRPRLNSKITDTLTDTYKGEYGFNLLLKIAKTRRVIIPLEKPKVANIKNLMRARSDMISIEKDRGAFMKILASPSAEDDAKFIMNHRRIQELLWAVERAYRNTESTKFLPSQEETDPKEKQLEELETYFGQLAYIGKYINDNLNPDPRIEVPMRLLSQFGLSYATLDDKYAETISDRVETILADPSAGDEEE